MKKVIIGSIIPIILLIGISSSAYQIKDNKYSMNEDLVKQISDNIPNYVSIDKIPENLKNAIVSVEDKRFFKHYGFDVLAISRAVYKDIKEGKFKQGGSTITQQLAKNLFLSADKKMSRKFKELILAIKLENKYTKDQILEMYLNVIYYGSGQYGIQNASKGFFGKNVWELSLEECAMLAGLPQAPSAYNPNKHYDRAKKRQEIVLALMRKNGFIDNQVEQKSQKEMILAAE
ncbi:transglycosylase domain-containing protein [Clostridium aestuarii]|uniref:Penicillin-binding protein 1A n=1 Tax=Clostridium aestuarii TaxID=338193 RepID=A0ABT4CYQ7_9CLOT|nr:biosynthetic peptidoglycan transglycosylase [Clostridium aestuarii]MCY6484104.1 transglycosylase domain-containing protein [Clostridium aestuarii]